MVNLGVDIGECVSTHYVRLTRTFRTLIQKSTGMDTPLLSISFFFLFLYQATTAIPSRKKKSGDNLKTPNQYGVVKVTDCGW